MAPPERRGEAINVGSLAVYLGLAFGPFLGETILAARDYTAVWIAAAVMAAATTVISLFVPETAPVALRPKDPDGRPQRSPLIHPAGLLPGSSSLPAPGAWPGFLAFVPLYLGSIGMGAAGPLLAEYALIVVVAADRVRAAAGPGRGGAAVCLRARRVGARDGDPRPRPHPGRAST